MTINVTDRTLEWYMAVATRLLFEQYWKQEKIPEIDKWIQKLLQ